jgi:glycosyltransferase involved in cell wall biosynthesis
MPKDQRAPRIFLFINVDWFAESHFIRFIVELSKKSELFLLSQDTGRLHIFRDYCNVIDLPSGRSSNSLEREIRSLLRVLKHMILHRPDIVEVVSIKSIIIWGLISRLLCIPRRVSYFTGLGSVISQERSMLSLTIYHILRLAIGGSNSYIIAENQKNLEFALERSLVNPKKCILLNGVGVDLEVFRPFGTYSYGVDTKSLTVGMASRLLRDKGVYEYIEACSIIEELMPGSYRYSLAGSTDEHNPTSLTKLELKALLSMHPYIRYEGHIDKMNKYLASLSLFVLPSYHEGYPKVLIEASACGIPVIATDIPGCRDIVEMCRNGLLVAPKNGEKLAEAMLLILTDDTLRSTFGKNSRKYALANYDAEKVAKQHVKFVLGS